ARTAPLRTVLVAATAARTDAERALELAEDAVTAAAAVLEAAQQGVSAMTPSAAPGGTDVPTEDGMPIPVVDLDGPEPSPLVDPDAGTEDQI
ncbi:MAG: hypothetical protein JWN57_190, partial [Frankiales bacterium]|nr:hypothetical protein [Frankiales bacterium]